LGELDLSKAVVRRASTDRDSQNTTLEREGFTFVAISDAIGKCVAHVEHERGLAQGSGEWAFFVRIELSKAVYRRLGVPFASGGTAHVIPGRSVRSTEQLHRSVGEWHSL
jgi:hypothetical protein